MGICRLPQEIIIPKRYDPVFANNSWEQIIEACHNNDVPDTWVADGSCYKDMTIDDTSYQIDIIGKNHDTYTSGGVAPLTFQMHDCYYESYAMNSDFVNSWINSTMRNSRLPSIFNLLPEAIQQGISEVNKLTSVGTNNGNIVSSSEKLFLLAQIEIDGQTNFSFSGEGQQYQYYAVGNSTVKNVVNGGANAYWTRSPYRNVTGFCGFDALGNATYDIATGSHYIAFAFCF